MKTLKSNKTINSYFETEKEAKDFMIKNEIFAMVAEYFPSYEKWALVFPIKGHLTVA